MEELFCVLLAGKSIANEICSLQLTFARNGFYISKITFSVQQKFIKGMKFNFSKGSESFCEKCIPIRFPLGAK